MLASMRLAVLALMALCASAYEIFTDSNSVDYYYNCPAGFQPFDFAWHTRHHWTLTKWASADSPLCAIQDTQDALCRKPNGQHKYWMTFFSGFATYKIEKFDAFSFSTFGTDYYYTYDSSAPMSQQVSSTLIPWYFSVKTLTFRVRGAYQITIIFDGPIYREIILTDAILDYRFVTFIAIDWPELPVFYHIEFIFIFDHMQSVKFFDLYMISCCEILAANVNVGK